MRDDVIINHAIITDNWLGIIKDKGFLNCTITVEYGPFTQGFGGWLLQHDPSHPNYKIKGVAGHFLYRVLQVADVDSWSDLKGRPIRVAIDNRTMIVGIGHPTKDDWFYPDIDFKNLK